MNTFDNFATEIVQERARFIRGPKKEANRFAIHIRTASFATMPIDQVRRRHIIAWHDEMLAKRALDRRGDRPLSKASIDRCHALVSVIFAEALRRDVIESNPCVGVKLRMPSGREPVRLPDPFLTHAEMAAIKSCAVIHAWDRWGMQFAWGTGLRQGEQCNLEVRDVHVDEADPFVFVRFGSKDVDGSACCAVYVA